MRLGKIRPGRSVSVDDLFREKIVNFSMFRPVSGKDVIEGPILANDYDHMLYRGARRALTMLRVIRGGERHANHRNTHREVHRGQKSGSHTNAAENFFYRSCDRHIGPFRLLVDVSRLTDDRGSM